VSLTVVIPHAIPFHAMPMVSIGCRARSTAIGYQSDANFSVPPCRALCNLFRDDPQVRCASRREFWCQAFGIGVKSWNQFWWPEWILFPACGSNTGNEFRFLEWEVNKLHRESREFHDWFPLESIPSQILESTVLWCTPGSTDSALWSSGLSAPSNSTLILTT
jgi:hypothetical protein